VKRVAVLAVLLGCATGPSVPYLDDRGHRRSELEASLVDPSNGYSQLRLQYYALPLGGWDGLPEWNPNAFSLDVDPEDRDAMVALGERAFFGFPIQIVPDRIGSAYGTWSDPVRGNGGVVVVHAPDTATTLAVSCSTCHATVRDGNLVPGLANADFDLGRLLVDGGEVGSAQQAAYLAWGPGRVDVTTLVGTEPVRIPDLRAVQWLTYLQADADVAQLDLDVLAIRLETLMITSHGSVTRPPRIVALAIATYVSSLADALPALPPASAPGASVFASECAGCHAAPSLTGPPVALDIIGTDPTVGLSAVRGTGAYRVPSLHGVGQRALLLHDGSLPSLSAMFDPTRTAASFTGGVRPGPVPGHLYGLALSASDRADLLSYLEAL
jgi:cytochrome c5